MKFSTTEEYGLRCLLQVARLPKDESLTIAEISRAEGLTIHNVAKLLRILRKGGFVRSVRGQTGGYALSRPPEEIPLVEVLATLGGRIFDPSFCKRHSGTEISCMHTTNCSIRGLLGAMQAVLDGFLEKFTLKDLLKTEGEVNRTYQQPASIEPLQ